MVKTNGSKAVILIQNMALRHTQHGHISKIYYYMCDNYVLWTMFDVTSSHKFDNKSQLHNFGIYFETLIINLITFDEQ